MWRINGKRAKQITQAVASRYQRRFTGEIYNSYLEQRVYLLNHDENGKEYVLGWIPMQ